MFIYILNDYKTKMQPEIYNKYGIVSILRPQKNIENKNNEHSVHKKHYHHK